MHVVLLLQTQQRAALFEGAATAVLLFYVPATWLSLSAAAAFAAAAAGYVCLVRASVETCLMSRGSASVAMSVLQYAERHRGV